MLALIIFRGQHTDTIQQSYVVRGCRCSTGIQGDKLQGKEGLQHTRYQNFDIWTNQSTRYDISKVLA